MISSTEERRALRTTTTPPLLDELSSGHLRHTDTKPPTVIEDGRRAPITY